MEREMMGDFDSQLLTRWDIYESNHTSKTICRVESAHNTLPLNYMCPIKGLTGRSVIVLRWEVEVFVEWDVCSLTPTSLVIPSMAKKHGRGRAIQMCRWKLCHIGQKSFLVKWCSDPGGALHCQVEHHVQFYFYFFKITWNITKMSQNFINFFSMVSIT